MSIKASPQQDGAFRASSVNIFIRQLSLAFALLFSLQSNGATAEEQTFGDYSANDTVPEVTFMDNSRRGNVDDRRLDRRTFLGSHNSYANPDEGIFRLPNQRLSTKEQISYGVRYLNPDIYLVDEYECAVHPYPHSLCAGVFEPGGLNTFDHTDSYGASNIQGSIRLVVAHNPTQLSHILNVGTRFLSFEEWLLGFKNRVVTEDPTKARVVFIEAEDYVSKLDDNGNAKNFLNNSPDPEVINARHNLAKMSADGSYTYSSMIMRALENVYGADALFFPDKVNDNLPAPYPFSGGWDVTKYGWPTEKQLLQHGIHIVWLTDSDRYIKTVFGASSVNQYGWHRMRDENKAVKTMFNDLFFMEHAPALPDLDFGNGPFLDLTRGLNNYGCSFPTLGTLCKRWTGDQYGFDTRTKWERIPNFLSVDHVDIYPGNTVGALSFRRNRDYEWEHMRKGEQATRVLIYPEIPESGWFNSPVTVSIFNSGLVSFRQEGFLYQLYDASSNWILPNEHWQYLAAPTTWESGHRDILIGSYAPLDKQLRKTISRSGRTILSAAIVGKTVITDVTPLKDRVNVNDVRLPDCPGCTETNGRGLLRHYRHQRTEQVLVQINIDRNEPELSLIMSPSAPMDEFTNSDLPEVTCEASDSLSGLSSESVLTLVRSDALGGSSGGYATFGDPGYWKATCESVTDKAGNESGVRDKSFTVHNEPPDISWHETGSNRLINVSVPEGSTTNQELTIKVTDSFTESANITVSPAANLETVENEDGHYYLYFDASEIDGPATNNITIIANDGMSDPFGDNSNKTTETFSVSVSNVNPTLGWEAPLLPSSVAKATTQSLAFGASDFPTDELTASYDCGPGSEVISNPATISNPLSGGILKCKLPRVVGDHEISITVQDDDGGSSTIKRTVELTNTAPTAECKDVTVEAEACLVDVDINDGSYDVDGDPITVSQAHAAPYPVGQDTSVTLTVDDEIETDSCSALVTCLNTPPTAAAVITQLTDIGGPALVSLSGANSSDFEDEAGELSYEWHVDTQLVCSDQQQVGDYHNDGCAEIETNMDYGSHEVVLTVTDTMDLSDQFTLTVDIDPSKLAIFDCEKLEVRFCMGDAESEDDDSSGDDASDACLRDNFKVAGSIGLPIGVNYLDLAPQASSEFMAGDGYFPIGFTRTESQTNFDIGGGDDEHWKHKNNAAGVSKFEIDWDGARFKFKDKDVPVEFDSELITSEATVLTVKYSKKQIPGTFTIDFAGAGQVMVDTVVDTVTSLSAGVEVTVKKKGKKFEVYLPFPLVDGDEVRLTGGVNSIIDVASHYEHSIGRFKVEGTSPDFPLDDGASIVPRKISLAVGIGSQDYPGSCEANAEMIKVYSRKWKAKK